MLSQVFKRIPQVERVAVIAHEVNRRGAGKGREGKDEQLDAL